MMKVERWGTQTMKRIEGCRFLNLGLLMDVDPSPFRPAWIRSKKILFILCALERKTDQSKNANHQIYSEER